MTPESRLNYEKILDFILTNKEITPTVQAEAIQRYLADLPDEFIYSILESWFQDTDGPFYWDMLVERICQVLVAHEIGDRLGLDWDPISLSKFVKIAECDCFMSDPDCSELHIVVERYGILWKVKCLDII